MHIKCIQYVFLLDFEQTLPINYMYRENEKKIFLYAYEFVIILNFQIQG